MDAFSLMLRRGDLNIFTCIPEAKKTKVFSFQHGGDEGGKFVIWRRGEHRGRDLEEEEEETEPQEEEHGDERKRALR